MRCRVLRHLFNGSKKICSKQGKYSFVKNGLGYFLYYYYEDDLRAYGAKKVNKMEFKIVIQDFINALSNLHSDEFYHSQVEPYNLVIHTRRDFWMVVLERN